ncbi:MAG: cytochrome c [Schlesneria sp.]|nr:cytochrome c [Schlesneria sp.]
MRTQLLSFALLIGLTSIAAAEGPSGEQIYKTLCASCHGATGEGNNKHYAQPLTGDRSVLELTEYIDRTMPEDDPGKCVGEDARRVAEYIHGTFYSPIAQARIKPPRIELARLTVRQYQNSIADLIGSFRGNETWTNERGLRGEYFKSRQQRREERAIERIDPIVSFDFGEGTADSQQIKPEAFSIKWEGSVIAPDTGDYEFVLLTENGAKLWVNNNRQPLIDAAVKSGKNVTERRESIRLLGGRAYPIRLEMFKSKEAKEKRASIVLKWKQPHRTDETIPQRCLLPQRLPETFILQTPFPPDDRSMGYERGTSISKDWEQATTDAAVEVAAFVHEHVKDLTGSQRDSNEHAQRLREFCSRFAERAFRRPLDEEQKAMFINKQFDEAASPDIALQRVILLVLQSPRFLFPELGSVDRDSYLVASRLSLAMWDSLPDERLTKVAAAGQLATPEQVRSEATRMMDNPRATAKLREFFLQWLKVDHFADLSKDSRQFPDFNASIASDLRTSLDLFLEEIINSPTADYRQLMQSNSLYLNLNLADFYRVDMPADALSPGEPGFKKITTDADQRAGVLTHPYLMAGFAYTASSSPIHRGVFLARSVLGRTLRPPPEAVAPLAPDLHASLTTRERVLLQTNPEACQTCHSMINPLGFTLEHFDAVGRYRRDDQNKPVDSSGAYVTRSGERKTFNDIRELADFLAKTDETHSAFVDQLFHNLIKQPIRAYGLQTPGALRAIFEQQQFNVRQLMIEIATTAALTDQAARPQTH